MIAPSPYAEPLQVAACADSTEAPPYGFTEFLARAEALRQRRLRQRLLPARIAALAATLSVALVGAALWRYVGVTALPEQLAAVQVASPTESPALVRAGHLAVRTDLEQRIAMLDAMLSESRVSGEQADSLRDLEQDRSTLADSLQRVAFAQRLVEP